MADPDRTRALPFAALAPVLLCPALACAAPGDLGSRSIDLNHRAARQWSVDLPQETWFRVSGRITVPHAGGDGFAVALEDGDLIVDTDGDGTPDREIHATADDYGVRTARVVLEGQRADGSALRYGVRLRDEGAGWHWAPGGVTTGTVDTEHGPLKLELIDRNGNGRYDDVGADAMIVGGGDVATFLSRTMLVDRDLWTLEVDPSGAFARLEPYEGETATFDMNSGLATMARLTSAVVRSTDGRHSFDLARTRGAMTVPAGDYEIVTGSIALGKQTVRVAPGRAETIHLPPGARTTFHWGGPVTGEFEYERAGDRVVFSPDKVWYYGAAGEQYLDWTPLGKSPEFEVVDTETGAVLEVLILPGSC